MRMKNDHEVADDFEEHFAENAGRNLDPAILNSVGDAYRQWPSMVESHPFTDPELNSFFADAVPGALARLTSFGCRFQHLPTYPLPQTSTCTASVIVGRY